MFCSKCGAELAPGFSFCTNCGAAVNESSVQPVPAAEPIPAPAPAPAPAPTPVQPSYTAPQYAAPAYTPAPQYSAPAPVRTAPAKQGMELRLQYVLTIMAAYLLFSLLRTPLNIVFNRFGVYAAASFSTISSVINIFSTVIAAICFIIVMASACSRRKLGVNGVTPAVSFVAMGLEIFFAILLFCFPAPLVRLYDSFNGVLSTAVPIFRWFAVGAFVSAAVLSGLCFLIKRRLMSNLIIIGAAAVLCILMLAVILILQNTIAIGFPACILPLSLVQAVFIILPNVGKWKNV